jgi:hypothetical protein
MVFHQIRWLEQIYPGWKKANTRPREKTLLSSDSLDTLVGIDFGGIQYAGVSHPGA